jgi:hypothetical protein
VVPKKKRGAGKRHRARRVKGPIALFLGAGASKPFGFPVTDEILPEVLGRLRRGDLFPRRGGRPARDADESARALSELLERLLPGLFRARTVLPMITDVFSLLDQMIATGSALGDGVDAVDLGRLRSLLERAVAEVLAEPRGGRGRAGAALQEKLADWIHRTCRRGRFVSVISTNYDFALERSLLSRIPSRQLPGAVDFGLSWRHADGAGARSGREAWPRPARPRLAVLKLHGALNWLRCPLCEHVVIHPSEPIFREGQGPHADSWLTCSCGFAPLRHVLVAPSMVRDVRDPNLLALWQSALEALRTAGDWIIVGYSLPPQDVEIRAMLLRAYRARPEPPRVRVVQHGPNRETEDRYRVMFPDMTFDERGVEGFVRRLRGTGGSARTSRAARAARRS